MRQRIVAQIMGYLKGKSSLMIFEKYANLKEPLIKSQEQSARDFVSKLRFGNRRNPLRISRFSNQ